MPTKEARKLIFDVENTETDHLVGVEFDQHIHVAVGTEVISQDGTEQRQFPDVMAPAELGDSLAVDGDPWAHFLRRHSDWNLSESQRGPRREGALRVARLSSPFDRLVRMTGDGDAAERLVRFEVWRAPERLRKEAARRACDRLAYERSR